MGCFFFFLRVPVFQTNPYATLTKKRKDFESYQYPENPIVECMGQNIYVWDPKGGFHRIFWLIMSMTACLRTISQVSNGTAAWFWSQQWMTRRVSSKNLFRDWSYCSTTGSGARITIVDVWTLYGSFLKFSMGCSLFKPSILGIPHLWKPPYGSFFNVSRLFPQIFPLFSRKKTTALLRLEARSLSPVRGIAFPPAFQASGVDSQSPPPSSHQRWKLLIL